MTVRPRRVILPGLRRGLPLLFLGALLLVGGGIFFFAEPAAYFGVFPAWLYCLPVGAIALIGGLATSFFPEAPEPVRAGSPVAEGLIAVPAADWLAVQRLLRGSAARGEATAAGGSAAPRGSSTPTLPAKDLMATSFAFAPALAPESSSSRRKRAGLPVRQEELPSSEVVDDAPASSTAGTTP